MKSDSAKKESAKDLPLDPVGGDELMRRALNMAPIKNKDIRHPRPKKKKRIQKTKATR